MYASYGVGRYVAAEGDTTMLPRIYSPNATRRGVLFFHGYGTAADNILDSSTPNRLRFVRAIAEEFPMIRPDCGAGTGVTGFNHFGNTNSQTRAGQAKTYLQSTVGAKSGKVLVVAVSMGNLLAINWAKNNPTLVSAILAVIPAWDIADIRDNDRGGYRDDIDDAWGVTYPAALPAGANPATDNAGANGIPYLAYYASDDTLVLPATVTAGAAAIGGTAVSVGATGHDDDAFAQIDHKTALDFLRSYA